MICSTSTWRRGACWVRRRSPGAGIRQVRRHRPWSRVRCVRLPSNLVTQSGMTSVEIDAIGTLGLTIDGRNVAGALKISGSGGADILLGGNLSDTIIDYGGDDIVVGGDGGDDITLTFGGGKDRALITNVNDGTIDINSTLFSYQLAAADRVHGLASDGNFISVSTKGLGLDGTSTFFLSAGQDIELGGAPMCCTRRWASPTMRSVRSRPFATPSARRSPAAAPGWTSRSCSSSAGQQYAVRRLFLRRPRRQHDHRCGRQPLPPGDRRYRHAGLQQRQGLLPLQRGPADLRRRDSLALVRSSPG